MDTLTTNTTSSSAASSFFKHIGMGDKRFDMICDLIQKILPSACVCQIDVVVNKELEEKYNARGAEFKDEIECCQAFHGTSVDVAPLIAEQGFRHDKNRRSLHGHGTYFAKDASFSFPYMSGADADGLSYMFLCDVRLTDTTVCEPYRKVKSGKLIYVVPNDTDCFPRYLVQFYKNA